MLKKCQMEYLLTLIPKESEFHDELHSLLEHGVKQYAEVETCDNFMKFMAINRHHETSNYEFTYQYDYVTVVVKMESHVITFDRIRSLKELEDLIYKYDLPALRFCSHCGAPMTEGYTDEWDYYCCQEEIVQRMDLLFGKGLWRSEPTGMKDYHYEYMENGKWNPHEMYYTEWA